MATQTRLFNIRISNDKHAQFKKYAEGKGKSMGGILLNYIDTLLDGTNEPVGFEEDKKYTTVEDPVDFIRSQYKKGEDF